MSGETINPHGQNLFATRDQELLLKAALLQGPDAIDAWQEWKDKTDLEGHLDRGSFRLLPLLYKNLLRHRVEDPFMNKLKGIYRREWYKNQMFFFEMSKVLRYLHEEGIRTMILKGAALTVLHYKDYGVRPMADIDVLVPTSDVVLAIDLLDRAGWTPAAGFTNDDLHCRHAAQLTHQSGKELDLHWHLLHESCRKDSDTDFWNGAVPAKMKDVSTKALNPADALLHVIVHGVKWNPEPPIRWIADAMSIINCSDSQIEWERLIHQAKKHRVSLRVKEALNYLYGGFQASVPVAVIGKLDDIRISLVERFEFRRIIRNEKTRGDALLGGFEFTFTDYLRLSHGKGPLAVIFGLSRYLLNRSRKKSLRHFLVYVMARGIKRTKRRLLARLVTNNHG
jgi:hypothetical protein